MTNTNSQFGPMVSIIVPNYNRDQLIKETLESVSNQTYRNWECIIVDDGSTDKSLQIINEFCVTDHRFKKIERNRLPKGAPTCRNIGVENAKGDYVIFLDSDDLLATTCLEQRLRIMEEHKDLDFIVFKSLLFTDSSNIMSYNKLWNIASEEDDFPRFLRFDAVWQTAGPLYKRDFILDFCFTEGMPFLQDADYAIKILVTQPRYKKFYNVPPDIFIRWDNESISRVKQSSKERFFKNLEVVYAIQQQVKSSRYTYKKQFVYTYYKLSKEAFNHKDSKQLCNAALGYLLKIGAIGYLFYIPLTLTQNSLLALRSANSKGLVSLRIQLRNILDKSIHRFLNISKPTLFKSKYQ